MHPGTKTPIKVHRVVDEAIDHNLIRLASGEVAAYPETGMPEGAVFVWQHYCQTRDASSLRFIEGAVPETYHVRTLSMSEAKEARLRGSDVERRFFAFSRGLVRVDKLLLESGERRDWTRPDDGSDKPKPIPEKIIEQFFDLATVEEIGEVVCDLSFYRRQSERTFALPPTCLDALRVITRRRAEQMNASSSSDESKSVPAATSATPPSSPDGADSTDATATASPSTSSTGPALSMGGPAGG